MTVDKIIEDYKNEVLETKQSIINIVKTNTDMLIQFSYDEKEIYQGDIIISLFDLISFVYSKI